MLIPLTQASEQPQDFGGKARGLAWLKQEGFRVPEAFILKPGGAPLTEASLARLDDEGKTLLAKWGAVAVRSSAADEDGVDQSYAGLFESRLWLRSPEEIRDAVEACLKSAQGAALEAYSSSPAHKHQLSLVVQGMVDAEFSGTSFSIHPVSGAREVITECVPGCGDKLTAGEADPARFRWRHDVTMVEPEHAQEKTAPEPRLLLHIAQQTWEIQQRLGYPVEVEWALRGGEVHWLQCRPITALPTPCEDDWTRANMKDGGLASVISNPFTMSFYRRIMNTSMPAYFGRLGLLAAPRGTEWIREFYGHMYWNLSATKACVARIPGYSEREFDEGLGVVPNYEGDGQRTGWSLTTGFRAVRTLLRLKASIRSRSSKTLGAIERCHCFLERARRVPLSTLDDRMLVRLLEESLEEAWFDIEVAYFYHIYDNSNLRTLFLEAFTKWNRKNRGEHAPDYLALVGALGEVPHNRPTEALWDLSRQIRQSASDTELYTSTPVSELCARLVEDATLPFAAEIREIQDEFGYKSFRELDLTVPRWREDPTQIFVALKGLLEQDDSASPRHRALAQQEAYLNARRGLTHVGLTKQLDLHRRLLSEREAIRDYSVRMFDWIREIVLESGRRLADASLLESADHVFMLAIDELLSALRAKEDMRGRGISRWRENRAFRNLYLPDEIYARPQKTKSMREDSKGISGIAGSSGCYRGRVRRIESVRDGEAIRDGEILITRYVDPAWATYFGRLGGLVTETGGVLSHGAVIAREYGVPAVFGAAGVLRTFNNGDLIEVDGDLGWIRPIEAGADALA